MLSHEAIQLILSVLVGVILRELLDAFDEVGISEALAAISVSFRVKYKMSFAIQTAHAVLAAFVIVATFWAFHDVIKLFYLPSGGSHAWVRNRYPDDKQ